MRCRSRPLCEDFRYDRRFDGTRPKGRTRRRHDGRVSVASWLPPRCPGNAGRSSDRAARTGEARAAEDQRKGFFDLALPWYDGGRPVAARGRSRDRVGYGSTAKMLGGGRCSLRISQARRKGGFPGRRRRCSADKLIERLVAHAGSPSRSSRIDRAAPGGGSNRSWRTPF